jgi:hypothetical protein
VDRVRLRVPGGALAVELEQSKTQKNWKTSSTATQIGPQLRRLFSSPQWGRMVAIVFINASAMQTEKKGLDGVRKSTTLQ